MEFARDNFWKEMLERVSISNIKKLDKTEFLKDTARFFDVSNAFIYEVNQENLFVKKEYYKLQCAQGFADEIDLKKELGYEFLSEFCSQSIIIISGDEEKTPLEQRVQQIFNAKTIILIPILNQHYELAGFVGIADRRKSVRKNDVDIEMSSAILSLIANNEKLNLFQKNIENAERTLSNVLDHIGIDIYVNDYYTHDILYVNKSMAKPYGGVEKMMGKKCYEALYTDRTEQCDICPQPKLLDEDGQLNKTYTWDYERPFDGSWFRVLSSSFPWTDGRVAHLVASVDITESKKNQIVIEKLAQFDHLTGLPNRRSLQDDVEMLIKLQYIDSWYVLFCDLDGFKKINDTLGHNAGDVFLKRIAEGLMDISSDEIRPYRQGGDEFVVLLNDKNSKEFLCQTIDKLNKIFREVYYYEGIEMQCGCSIGISHYSTTGKTVKEIFHNADMAMYSAKKAGKNTVRFYKSGGMVSLEEYFA